MDQALLELNAYIQEIELKNEQLVQHGKAQQVLIEQLQNCLLCEANANAKKNKCKKTDPEKLARQAFYNAHKNDGDILSGLRGKLQKAGIESTVIPWQLVQHVTDTMFYQIKNI